MGGVSDRGEEVVYPGSTNYPEYALYDPNANAPTPTAPPPAAPSPSHPAFQQWLDTVRGNLQQKAQKANAMATMPIPYGLSPDVARNLIHYQGQRAMASIPDQGPSPQFSAGYEDLMKKAYPS